MMLKPSVLRQSAFGLILLCLGSAACGESSARPVGFVKSTIALNAPPVGLAFDADGVLYALEAAAAATPNVVTLRAILPDGSYGDSFPVIGDDMDNFYVGGMAYDHVEDRFLITDNTGDGRLYAVDKTGAKSRLAMEIGGIAGVAVRDTGEIFVSTAPFGNPGAVLLVDRIGGGFREALPELDLALGAGLAFDPQGDLVVQDAILTPTFETRGRLQRLLITESTMGLVFDGIEQLKDDMDSGYSLAVDGEGDIFTTGTGGLYSVAGSPLMETSILPSQFAAAIAFDPGTLSFESFAGPGGGRLALASEASFGMEDQFVTLLTPARPGDYTGDNIVDSDDHSLWAQTFAASAGQHADGNLDGTVDAADYVAWRKFAVDVAASHGAAGVSGVPEPAMSWVAIVIGIFGWSGHRSGRSQRHRQNGAPR
jgi:hypothetical protein